MPPLQLTVSEIQDSHSFVASATLKLSGLGAFLSIDAPRLKRQVKSTLGHYGPGISVYAIVESLPSDPTKPDLFYNTIGFSVEADAAICPCIVTARIAISSYLGNKTFGTRTKTYMLEKHMPRRFWDNACQQQDWEKWDSVRFDDGFLVRIRLSSSQQLSTPSPPVETILHKALHSIEARDVRFTVFDRRDKDGLLYDKRVLVADGKTLRFVSKSLGKLISEDPAGRWDGVRVESLSDDDIVTTTYTGYDSDFQEDEEEEDDLAEDDDDDDMTKDDGEPSEPAAKKACLKPDTEDTVNAVSADGAHQMKRGLEKMDGDPNITAYTQESSVAQINGSEKDIIDVVVVGASSVAWEALLFYVYTAIIEFAPLYSSGGQERRAYIENYAQQKLHRPKPCSPKTMYRLANELGLVPLRKMCLQTIKRQLTHDNIITEIFSTFTAEYQDVKSVEIDYLARNWEAVKDSDAFKDTMQKVVQGAYPHAGKLLTEIFQTVGSTTGKV